MREWDAPAGQHTISPVTRQATRRAIFFFQVMAKKSYPRKTKTNPVQTTDGARRMSSTSGFEELQAEHAAAAEQTGRVRTEANARVRSFAKGYRIYSR